MHQFLPEKQVRDSRVLTGNSLARLWFLQLMHQLLLVDCSHYRQKGPFFQFWGSWLGLPIIMTYIHSLQIFLLKTYVTATAADDSALLHPSGKTKSSSFDSEVISETWGSMLYLLQPLLPRGSAPESASRLSDPFPTHQPGPTLQV